MPSKQQTCKAGGSTQQARIKKRRQLFRKVKGAAPGPGFSLAFGNGSAPTDDPNGYTWNIITTREAWADYATNGDTAMIGHNGEPTGIRATGQTLSEWGFQQNGNVPVPGLNINGFPGSALIGYARNQSASSWSALSFTGFPPSVNVKVELLTVSDVQGVRNDFGSGAGSSPDTNPATSEGTIIGGTINDIDGLNTNGGTVVPSGDDGLSYYTFNMTSDQSGNCCFLVRGHGTSLAAVVAAVRMTWDTDTAYLPNWEPEVDDGTFDLTGLEGTDVYGNFLDEKTGTSAAAFDFDWLYSGTIRYRWGSSATPYIVFTSDFTNGIDLTLSEYEFRIIRYPGYGQEDDDTSFSAWTAFAFGVDPEWTWSGARQQEITTDNRAYFTVEIRDVATQTIRVRKNFVFQCKRIG